MSREVALGVRQGAGSACPGWVGNARAGWRRQVCRVLWLCGVWRRGRRGSPGWVRQRGNGGVGWWWWRPHGVGVHQCYTYLAAPRCNAACTWVQVARGQWCIPRVCCEGSRKRLGGASRRPVGTASPSPTPTPRPRTRGGERVDEVQAVQLELKRRGAAAVGRQLRAVLLRPQQSRLQVVRPYLHGCVTTHTCAVRAAGGAYCAVLSV